MVETSKKISLSKLKIVLLEAISFYYVVHSHEFLGFKACIESSIIHVSYFPILCIGV